MSAADIQAKAFTDNDVAREAIEALMWPNGPVCPHCGCTGKIGKVEGKSARPGLYYCGDCKKQFTVTVGTIFERSKVPLSKWWMAIHLMASSKKGMSAHQLHRMLGVAYQTAWFMEHRIREAMRDGALSPMGGGGGVVEIDETYIGRKDGFEVKQGAWHKNTTLTLVERDGRALVNASPFTSVYATFNNGYSLISARNQAAAERLAGSRMKATRSAWSSLM